MVKKSIKNIIKDAIIASQSGIKNKLDTFAIELIATNVTNEVEKYCEVR